MTFIQIINTQINIENKAIIWHDNFYRQNPSYDFAYILFGTYYLHKTQVEYQCENHDHAQFDELLIFCMVIYIY